MSLATLPISSPVATFTATSFSEGDGFHNIDGVHAGRCDVSLIESMLLKLAHEVTATLPTGTTSDLSRDNGRMTRPAGANTGSTSGSGRSSAGSAQHTRTGSTSSPSMMSSDAMSPPGSRYSPGESVVTSEGGVGPNDGTYHLEVVQHPVRVSELGNTSVLSRLPLQPAPIVRLIVRDSNGNVIPAFTEMPFLAAHLNLYNEDGTEPIDLVDSASSQRMLYGTLVSSLHTLVDLEGQQGMFFIFPDISVRTRGRYTLRVNLLRLTGPTGGTMVMPEGMRNAALAWVMTEAFSVVMQSEYTAPPATALTNLFHRQGARMYTPFQPTR